MPSKSPKLSRRNFLKCGGLLAAGGTMAFPAIVPSSVFGANAPSNRITVGCIGLGGMGTSNLKAFMAQPASEVVAVCDVYRPHREKARNKVGLDSKSSYNDFRELLARSDIDAAAVVTPDHWHVPISIAAAKAGKDVYCEKPLTLTIGEGRLLCDTVRKYGRVLQTGSQQRSSREFRRACELVRNGRIGELHTIRVEIPGNNKECPPTWQVEPVPEGFDYDFWLGCAPRRPYTEQRCFYTFRFILDYSGGQMTNWGAHAFDIAQWGNGSDDAGPIEIEGRGEFPRSGLFTTAAKADIVYRYANGVRMFCKTGGGNRVRFEGDEGWIQVERNSLTAEPQSILNSDFRPNKVRLFQSNDHHKNFLDCVKLRQDPIANVEIGHRSATVCHLGNIAMLLGRKVEWDPEGETFVNDPQANKLLTRGRRAPWRI